MTESEIERENKLIVKANESTYHDDEDFIFDVNESDFAFLVCKTKYGRIDTKTKEYYWRDLRLNKVA